MSKMQPAKAKRPLTAVIYHNDDAAREHLESLLWPDGPNCPRCGVMGDRITKLQGKSTRPGVYKCKDCRKPFSVTVGTVMERSHVPLCKWVMAAHFMANEKKSQSALALQRFIGTNYETAWFLFHRLRECTPTPSEAGPLGGTGPPVLLHIKSGETHSFCLAEIVRGSDGKLRAHPFVVAQDPAFARLGTPELDGRFLELLPDGGGGKPIHLYRGIVSVPQ